MALVFQEVFFESWDKESNFSVFYNEKEKYKLSRKYLLLTLTIPERNAWMEN